jgi:hypothetical protein
MQNWILKHVNKSVFRFLEPFRARLASKFATSAHMTPIFFLTIIPYVKKMQNVTLIWNCWKSLEKVAEKIQGSLLLPTVLNYKKQQHHIEANKFFGRNFFTRFEIRVKFCIFLYRSWYLERKFVWGHINSFCKLRS